LLTVKLTATDPKLTAVAPVKPVPVMVTEVPPPVLPLLVPRPVTLGAAALLTVNWSAGGTWEVPVRAVTGTSQVPARRGGERAGMEVSLLTVKLAAATEPNITALEPLSRVPVMVTEVPPAVVPLLVLRPVTDGVVVKL